ncbi:hypothetical protein OHA72_38900 [Dactylosporangium sp. NBC_01737]|uniref:hypothetical protein n=1 Tax=Dactylosporangium sp. NBC_01737 TaxID=2975959 RepID=UPI002E0F0D2F|nr:hypothetical protein OHA72_38900 [Dactylosporangium sp. NBC_01737]
MLGVALLLLTATWLAARCCRFFVPCLPQVRLDETASSHVDAAAHGDRLRLAARPPGSGEPVDRSSLLLEVAAPGDARHAAALTVTGLCRDGRPVLRTEAWDVPDAIAAVLLHLRDRTGLRPDVHFHRPQRHPAAQWLRFLLLGTGAVVPLTRQLLHETEPDPARRPTVHIG